MTYIYKLNINNARADKLLEIDGVGEALVQRILQKRRGKKYFKSIEELKDIKGIGDTLYNKLKDKLKVNLDINKEKGCGLCTYLIREDNSIKCSKKNLDLTTFVGLVRKRNGIIKIPFWCPLIEKVNLLEIEIPKNYVLPNEIKVEQKIRHYERTGRMDTPLAVQEKSKNKYLLLSGYTRYLAGEKLGVENIEVAVIN